MPMIDAYRTPTQEATREAVVTFWSRPIKDRLGRSSLSPGQAAKRDLARYHALLDDALPPISRRSAIALTRAVQDDPGSLQIAHWTPDIWANFLGNYVDPYGRHYADLIMVTDLLECLALLDAADRCAAEATTLPAWNLADLIPAHFRLTGEEEE